MMGRIKLIVILLIVSICLIVFLLVTTTTKRILATDFERVFPTAIIVHLGTVDLTYNSYYIAGQTFDNIFLGNYTSPLHVLAIDESFKQRHFKIETYYDQPLARPRLTIDSSTFYLIDSQTQLIFSGDVNDFTTTRQAQLITQNDQVIPIASASYLVRTIDSMTSEYLLAKQFGYAPHLLQNSNILQKQIDGIFCTDGLMTYNKELDILTYVYYYRNEFICTDSNLNLSYRAHTIDTFRNARISLAEIRTEKSITMSSPPSVINKLSSTSGKYLFINSNVIGKNENEHTFSNSVVIDVYALNKGSYVFSLNVGLVDKRSVHGFQVFNDRLVLLEDHFLHIYKLNIGAN